MPHNRASQLLLLSSLGISNVCCCMYCKAACQSVPAHQSPAMFCVPAFTDAYKQNCSSSDVRAWQGGSGDASKAQPAPPTAPSEPAGAAVASLSSAKGTHTTMAAAPFQHLVASCVQPFKSPVVSDGAQPKQQPKSGWKSSSTVRTLPTSADLSASLGSSKQRPSSCALQASLPQPAAAEPDAATAMGEEQHGRESLGGTQGAITGLTHMALQKHNDAMPAASAGPSVESQGLGMQACFSLIAASCW